MAKIFGIEEEQLAELPDSMIAVLKAAHAEGESTKTLLEEFKKKLNPEETEEQKSERLKAEETARNTNAGITDPALLLNLQNRRDIILMNLASDGDAKIKTAVKLFRGVILENLAKSNPKLWADEAYVRNIVDLVIGRNFAAIVADMGKEDGQYNEFFVEGGNSGRGRNEPEVVNLERLLSEDEKKAATSMGMSHADYAKGLDEVRKGIY